MHGMTVSLAARTVRFNQSLLDRRPAPWVSQEELREVFWRTLPQAPHTQPDAGGWPE